MNLVEFILSAVCMWLIILVLVIIVYVHKMDKEVNWVVDDYKKFKKDREKFYKQMSKVAGSPGDFREVNLTEARRTAPRENAGPPAVVHRPPLRAVKPTSWRPPRSGSPRI